MHKFWNLSALFFRWVGKQVDITTGLLIFAIIGIAFNGPLPSLERNIMNAQGFSIGRLGMTAGQRSDMCIDFELLKDGIIFPESTQSSEPQQVAPVEDFSKRDGKLDINDPGNCPLEIPGDKFTIASYVPLCEHISQHENTYEIEQSENQLFDTASCDKLEENNLQAVVNYVFSLEYNLLSLLSVVLLLAGEMFGFMRRWPDIGIRVAIIIVVGAGISEFLTYKNSHLATSFQYDCAILMYIVAHSLMLLSLILKQAEREWLCLLMAGISYSCVGLVILGYSISCLTLEYAFVEVSVLFAFVLCSVRCVYFPDRIDEGWMIVQ